MSWRAVVMLLVVLPGCTTLASDPPADEEVTPQATYLPLPGALLWAIPYSEIEVEVHYVEGREPFPGTLDALREALETHTLKRSVLISPPARIEGHTSDPDRKWDVESLRALHLRTTAHPLPAGVWGEGEAAYLHVVFLDGIWDNEGVKGLGVQMDNVLGIFKDQFRSFGPIEPRQREMRVMIHELGHAFGLVNCGIPMLTPREEPDSRCHSVQERSVMYVRTPFLYYVLDEIHDGGFIPQRFDEMDLADIASYRDAGPTAQALASASASGLAGRPRGVV